MKKFPSLWIGIIGCSILAIFFFFGPYLPKVDGQVTKHPFIMINNYKDITIPPFSPSWQFPLGTDHQGRDLLSALIIGTRETLMTVGIITGFTFLLGIPIGVGAAHSTFIRTLLKGWNYLFSRIPVFFFIIILATIPFFVFSPSRQNWMILFLILLEVGKVADVVMKGVRLIQKNTYFEAAISSGTKLFGLWKWYYWPECYPRWIAYFIQHLGSVLFLLGQLGIFNIFISQALTQEGSPAYAIQNTSLIWPMFLSNVYVDIHVAPWQLFYSSLFITFAMFSFIALGDGILNYSLQTQRGILVPKQGLFYKFLKSIKSIFATGKEMLKSNIPALRIGIIGCGILAILYFFGPYLPKIDEDVSKHSYILGETNNDIFLPPFSPSARFPLGSDNDGRDLLSSLVIGTKETLKTVGIITGLTFLLGIPLGVGAAHIRILRAILHGWNYLFSRIPLFFFIIILSTIPFFIFSPNRPKWMIALLVILELGKVADVVHKSVQQIQKTTYYEASIASGTKIFGLWKWYYWPGCYPGWVAYFIQHMGSVLFLLGQLGIFNIFISQTIGQTIENSPQYAIENASMVWPMFLTNVIVDSHTAPWILLFSSLFITFAMFSFISLGEGIQEFSLLKHRGLPVYKQKSPFGFKISFKELFKSRKNIDI